MSLNIKTKEINIITILVDNNSWILPYAQQLLTELSVHYQCQLVRAADNIPQGDICFFLGCTQIVSDNILSRNQHNLVVHESNLPQGKGFAPMSWQILAGESSIHVCLVEANKEVDCGEIWLTDIVSLDGTELHDDWRTKQGECTLKLAKEFIVNYQRLRAKTQKGESSYYPRRTTKDSELDINKSLKEQFNLLRVVSNKDYPAFFIKDGVKYKLEISKISDNIDL